MSTPFSNPSAQQIEAINYLKQYNIAQHINTALETAIGNNNLNDPYSICYKYFSSLASPPIISNVHIRSIYDSTGFPCYELDVYISHNNIQHKSVSLSLPL